MLRLNDKLHAVLRKLLKRAKIPQLHTCPSHTSLKLFSRPAPFHLKQSGGQKNRTPTKGECRRKSKKKKKNRWSERKIFFFFSNASKQAAKDKSRERELACLQDWPGQVRRVFRFTGGGSRQRRHFNGRARNKFSRAAVAFGWVRNSLASR